MAPSPRPSSVVRANLRGARWNPPGVEALYCSLDPGTAAAEIDNLLAAQPVPITRQRLTYPLRVRLTRIVDLRPHPFASGFDYEHDVTNTVQCRTIGAAAAWLGAGGIIVPSVRAGGDNLVIPRCQRRARRLLRTRRAVQTPAGPPPNVVYEPISSVGTGEP